MTPNDFIHDFAAGYSFGLQRFYYNNPDRNYVGSCEKGDKTFEHNVQTTSWVNSDSKLKAKPRSDVWIRVEGSNHTIASNTLLPNAEFVAYNLIKEEEVARAGDATFNGCIKTTPSSLMKTYERPDGSEYVKNAGAGAGVDKDVCVRKTETKNGRKYTEYSPSPGRCERVFAQEISVQEYKTRVKTTYPDGKVEYSSWSDTKKTKTGKGYGWRVGSDYHNDRRC